MAKNITLTGAGFNASGKFGQSLNAGSGQVSPNPLSTVQDFTFELWFKRSGNPGGIEVFAGCSGGYWMGMLPNGTVRGTVGTSGVDLISSASFGDGAWHHAALVAAPYTAPGTRQGTQLYIDGALVASFDPSANNDPVLTNPLEFRIFGGSFAFAGEIDDVALTAGRKYTAAFTPPTAAIANNASGLLGLWHLDGDGTDSASSASAATAITLALSASSGPVGQAVTVTVGTNNPLTGSQSQSVALSADKAGTWSANPVTLDVSNQTRGPTFTQTGAGVAVITATPTGTPSLSAATISHTATSADSTAPILSAPTSSVTGPTTATVGVTTDEGNGNLYCLVSANAVENFAAVMAGGTVQAISSAGAKSFNIGSLTPNTAYYPHFAHRDSSNNDSGVAHGTQFTTQAAPANALDTSKMILSPGNWNVGANSLKAVNAGAYFRTLFSGNACTLQFDMTGVTAPSRFWYRIDNGPMVQATVAATVALAMRSDSTDWGAKGGHLLEFFIKERTNYVEVWTSPVVLVSLSGISLDTGATLLTPGDARPLKGLCFGDSITEGQATLNGGASGDALLSYALHLRNLLTAEIGLVGFGGQGWTTGGGGNSPTFPTAFNKIYAGVNRSFAGLDFITINQGTNDGGNNVTTAATGVLNAILADASLPSSCKIIVMRPFNGTHASELQAAIAACSAPSRVSYMDTTGFYNSTNSVDSIHPFGNEGLNHISPLVAASIRTILAGTPATTSRTVTLSELKTDGSTLATGLTGVKVSFRDAAGPDIAGPLSYQSSTQTITGGILTFAANTTLASGATGWIDVKGAGVHFCGPVAVS